MISISELLRSLLALALVALIAVTVFIGVSRGGFGLPWPILLAALFGSLITLCALAVLAQIADNLARIRDLLKSTEDRAQPTAEAGVSSLARMKDDGFKLNRI